MLLHKGNCIISCNQGLVLERSLSHLLSILLLLLFSCEDQRDTTLVMGGLHLFGVPFILGLLLRLLHLSPSQEKVHGRDIYDCWTVVKVYLLERVAFDRNG